MLTVKFAISANKCSKIYVGKSTIFHRENKNVSTAMDLLLSTGIFVLCSLNMENLIIHIK
jgi:hypothetical protein